MSERHAWIDASAGIAGDMLLGALVDAGADLDQIQTHVDAVAPGAVRLVRAEVSRAGQRATKVDVQVLVVDQPVRRWRDLRATIADARLLGPIADRALRTFERLATAEARVHGIAVDDVHFHEVGALDSIADVVGVSAALFLLGVDTLSGSAIALGSGRTQTAHGQLAVPVPAVVELVAGWRVQAGGQGELATPTGVALLTTLGELYEDLPALTLAGSGTGAGTRDTPGRANVVRVLLGDRAPSTDTPTDQAVLLEANVDDLDPRLWPGVLHQLLEAGADDVWLTPILMKKGRPAHTLSVLTTPAAGDRLRDLIISETSTFGVRSTQAAKFALPRGWLDVTVDGRPLPVKIAHRDGVIRQVTAEFAPLDGLAHDLGTPTAELLVATQQAATTQGLVVGAPVPTSLRTTSAR